MSTPSMEEAYRAVPRGCPACDDERCIAKVEAAVRACMKATLEEAWEAAKQDLEWTHVKLPCAATMALAARIDALDQCT